MVAARALGLEERGRQVVAETEAAIAAVRDANPGPAGKTVTFSFAFAPGQIVTLKSDQDPASGLLQELGLRIPPTVAQLSGRRARQPGRGPELREHLPARRRHRRDAVHLRRLQQDVEAFELFRDPRGVRDGRYIVIDLPTASALRTPTVLSIPWALDQISSSLARLWLALDDCLG